QGDWHGDADGDCTVRHRSAPVQKLTHQVFTLSVKEGPNTGAMLSIDQGSCDVFLGSSPACAIRLTDPLVSRRHVGFDVHDGCLRMRDAGSTNGTYVNGTRTVEALLSGGETIRIGATVLAVDSLAASTREIHAIPAQTTFGSFVGASVAVRRLYPLCEKLAA